MTPQLPLTRSLKQSLALVASLSLTCFAGAQDAAGNGGFLTGLRGFEHFHEPVGQPIYFETPFNDTGVRALYLKHDFAGNSALMGGDVTIYALQARVALSERWQFIATKDGYSELSTGLLGNDEGWNDIAFGLKYVLHADKEKDYVVSAGMRYMAEHGHRGILQGGTDEFSPFVSLAKGYDNLHLISNVTLRVPTDTNQGNVVGHWDVHLDYSINPESDTVVAPVFEVHGVHYLDDGATALPIGGLDYANLGTQPAKNFVAWAGIGGRLEINKQFEFGVVYEFALTDKKDDIMDTRLTVDFIARW
tara:strand:+ start:19912 stop:20826 length:915 start_codon:yes stop_codon:yes gene_type:complete